MLACCSKVELGLITQIRPEQLQKPSIQFSSAIKLNPTDKQHKVIEAAKVGKDLVVQALAGTGKTTTQKLLAETLYDKKGAYIAFNKAIERLTYSLGDSRDELQYGS